MQQSNCTARDFQHPRYFQLCKPIEQTPTWHRKQWEYIFILHHLERTQGLTPGKRGVGFGVGIEPLPSTFARLGAHVLGTDAPEEIGQAAGCVAGNEHSQKLTDMRMGWIPEDLFVERVAYQPCDMNNIAENISWSLAAAADALWAHHDRPPIQGHKRIVLFVGRLERRKGVDTLIEAATMFLKDHPDVGLVFCGANVEGWASGAQAILGSELMTRVLFAGAVPDSVRETMLSVASCLVFPSRHESFGLVPSKHSCMALQWWKRMPEPSRRLLSMAARAYCSTWTTRATWPPKSTCCLRTKD